MESDLIPRLSPSELDSYFTSATVSYVILEVLGSLTLLLILVGEVEDIPARRPTITKAEWNIIFNRTDCGVSFLSEGLDESVFKSFLDFYFQLTLTTNL
jgi:hypothetical protein